MMVLETRHGGLDKAKTGLFGISYDPNVLEIYADYNGNGVIDPNEEWIGYRFNVNAKQLEKSIGGAPFIPVCDNLTDFKITYLGRNGHPVFSTEEIRAVKVKLVGEMAKKTDGWKCSESQMRWVKVRNLGLDDL